VLGKPVIASDTLGVREYVEHGRTGLVVPPGDPAALREAIAWAIAPEHAAEVRAMGARARAWALGHFGPEQYARRLLSLALGGPIP